MARGMARDERCVVLPLEQVDLEALYDAALGRVYVSKDVGYMDVAPVRKEQGK